MLASRHRTGSRHHVQLNRIAPLTARYGARAVARQVGLDRRAWRRLCHCRHHRARQRGHGDQSQLFVVGIMMLIAGVAEVINAFQIKTWGKFLLWLLLGALYIVAGFFAFENPLLAAAALTLLLGISLLVSGIMRIVIAFSMQETMPWIWVAFSGLITFLLGLLIVAHWPVSSLYVLAICGGADLVIAGAGGIGIGLGRRRHA